MEGSRRMDTRRLTGSALLTALVVILQLLGSFIRFGVFSISLVNIPIVVGAVLYGKETGAWLGLVFGVTVLLSGDASVFMAVSIFGTLLVVLLKGTAAGYLAGAVCERLTPRHELLGSMAAALLCPIVNTGIFLLGCLVFFMPTIRMWAEGLGMGDRVGVYMLTGFVGVNFLLELGSVVVLGPVILRIIRLGKGEQA